MVASGYCDDKGDWQLTTIMMIDNNCTDYDRDN